ncbi:MAG: hypothetical protein WCD31_06885 [Gillisia sp.]
MKLKNLFIIALLFILPSMANAQCAMCRAVLESQDSHSVAAGVNNGILYLMIFPYVLVGGLGIVIYRAYKKAHSS